MMNCQQIESQGVIEQYVANRLSNAERKEFELHYFACDRCFEALEACRAAGTALKRMPRVAPRSRQWIWPAAIAAAAAVAFIALRFTLPPVPAKIEAPAPVDLAMLVHVEPPSYAPPSFRGNTDSATQQFHAAMEPYRQGNYSSTIEALQNLLRGANDAKRPFVDAEFFLGACYLLTDRPDDALAALAKVIPQDSPYQEEARFLTAEAWLRKRDTAHARAELETVVQGNGELKASAEKLLHQLPGAP